jgi:hypothetical protein
VKICGRCNQALPVSDFYPKTGGGQGVTGMCRTCIKSRQNEYHKANRESSIIRMRDYRSRTLARQRASDRQRYAENPEARLKYVREWRKKHPDRARASYNKWMESNWHIKYAIGARRRANKINATPAWLSEEHHREIANTYKTCPTGYHVDHIIPLNGENVCGLHVPWNLQQIPAVENMRKGNKLVA